MDVPRLERAGLAYIERGWSVFVVRDTKIPFSNCERCRPGAGCPGGATCVCPALLCHGFYAGTRDAARLVCLLWCARDRSGGGGGGMLAVRTGAASGGLVVVDVDGEQGQQTLEEWQSWSGGQDLPETLRAHTVNGGMHLFYTVGAAGAGAAAGTGSPSRVLPGVDIRGERGYVVCPPAAGRRWEEWSVAVAPAPSFVRELAGRKSGTFGSGAGGRDAGTGGDGRGLLYRYRSGVVPAGERYAYTRDFVYSLRRGGWLWQDAVGSARWSWERYEQPPGDEFGWGKVMYELERVWLRVQPDSSASVGVAWERFGGHGGGAT